MTIKQYAGKGIIWDVDKNIPLIDFTKNGTCITGDDKKQELLESKGFDFKIIEVIEEDEVNDGLLEDKTVPELKEVAKELGLDFNSKVTKTELINLIEGVNDDSEDSQE